MTESRAGVRSITADGDDVFWLVYANRLVRWDRGQVRMLGKDQGFPCDAVYATALDLERGLWVYAACGVVHLARSEIDRWLDDSAASVATKLFDAYDGATRRRPTFRRSRRARRTGASGFRTAMSCR